MNLDSISRAWCRWFGHRWSIEDRGVPVTRFAFCARCNKIGPRLVSEAA